MWYRICIATPTPTGNEQTYVESLRWRRGDLQAKIAVTRERIDALNQEEAALRQELRAVEQLLFAADGGAHPVADPAPRPAAAKDAATTTRARSAPDDETLDLSGYGPTARKIYATTEQVVRAAGVPLHYRVLAEEVQKKAPLSGKDPGATLIAHLHRAQDLFPRVGRGVYGVRGMVDSKPASHAITNGKKTATRRRRTRRRRTR